MPLTLVPASMQESTAQYTGFKNRIINGEMDIDQRNAGASVTATTSNPYLVDRWCAVASQNSKYTAQQNAASVARPAGFTNYLGATSSSAYTVLTADYFALQQIIEGLNLSDLGWGTANASAVTLSFWVRSSLTGTFGGSLTNNGSTRSYPFSYTISSANTWEQKIITIAGDTSGTWLTTNGVGIRLGFGLGVGATYSGTAGVWSGSNFVSATGATSVVGTSGATFYITGVQLEKGSVATSFDFRSIGQETLLCQRYYQFFGGNISMPYVSTFYTARRRYCGIFPVPMRATPTMTGTFSYDGTGSNASIAANNQNNYDAITDVTGAGFAANLTSYTANAEL